MFEGYNLLGKLTGSTRRLFFCKQQSCVGEFKTWRQHEVNHPASFGATKKATIDQLTDPWESAVQQLYCDSDKQLSVDAVGLSC